MEKLIPISITSARVEQIGIIFDPTSHLPDFSVEVSLLDSEGKKITSIRVDSRDYYGVYNACQKSVSFMELSAKLRGEIDLLVTKHLNKINNTLEYKP